MLSQHHPFATRQEAEERLQTFYVSDVHRIATRRFEQLPTEKRQRVFDDFMETKVATTLPKEHLIRGSSLREQPILRACLAIHLTDLWAIKDYIEFDFWMVSNGYKVTELPDGGAWIFKNGRPVFVS